MKTTLGIACSVTAIATALACTADAPDIASGLPTPVADAAAPLPDATASQPKPRDAGAAIDNWPVVCGDNVVTTYAWTGPSAPRQGRCTDPQMGALISECIMMATSSTAKCDAYQASADYSKDCDRCMNGVGSGDDNTSVSGLHVPVLLPISLDGTNYKLLNTDACAASALGLGETCGNAVTQLTACKFGACARCSDTTLDECLDNAAAGLCKSQVDAIQVPCLDKIEAGRATWEPLCRGGKTAFKDVVPIMAKYMCGASE